MRYDGRRTERGDIRPGALGDGSVPSGPRNLRAVRPPTACRARRPPFRAPPRAREVPRIALRASPRTSPIKPVARSRRPACRRAPCAKCRWPCWWIRPSIGRRRRGYKRALVPPAPEKLKVIHDLVAGITGFNAERGDQLIVETLPFETTLLTEPPRRPPAGARQPAPPPLPFGWSPQILAIVGGVGLVLIVVLAASVLRREGSARRAGQLARGSGGGRGGETGMEAAPDPSKPPSTPGWPNGMRCRRNWTSRR